MNNEEAYKERLAEDPGDECFVDFADHLRLNKHFLEAIGVCLAGLSSNPAAEKGRLVLARIFYDAGYISFALREVKELQETHPDNPALKRLAETMLQDRVLEEAAEEASEPEDEVTVAESDFDLDDLN